jgi:uncharacterized glyoxalase superfamily protein PhnB
MAAHQPPGWHSVIPRIVTSDVAALVAFLRHTFGARGEVKQGRPCEVAIGDSIVMVSSLGERELFPAFLYVYVADVQATFDRALEAGATALEAPQDTPYGDYRAMLRDAWGNLWQIASRSDSRSRSTPEISARKRGTPGA